jgi:predicted TIM-barrel fold metal-dependent hydrolase
MRKVILVLAAAVCTATFAVPAAAAAPLALVDSHTHLMVENLTPDEEIALLKKAGIARVVLMHNEPEAIAALAKKYPGFVIPSLSFTRPTARSPRLDDTTGPLIAALHADRRICSVGEMNGASLDADTGPLHGLYAAAASSGAPVIVHTDLARPENIAAVEAAVTAYPKLQFVLAHLGWTAGPELIGRLLDAHRNLYTDLSIRLDPPGSVAWRNNGLDLSVLQADDTFQPEWRTLILRHPDRFLFAMDINSFGQRYTMTEVLVSTARKAFAPLPRRVQEAVAHGNIERLLRGCGR